jgi:hypothetical protein
MVTGLKIVSDIIAWQRQQNYDGSAFCVTLVPFGAGSEALFLNGACEQAVENENSFGG